MGWYGDHVVPHVVNIACGMTDIERQREKVVPLAEGTVRRIPEMIRGAGFAIDTMGAAYIPGPKFVSYEYWGTASRT